MSEELLPNSAGPFTRALAYTFDTHRRYALEIDRIRFIGITDTPDDWVPWLIYDQGLEDVIPYVRTFRKVLAEGPAWQARRGTPDGISIGIGWVESEGVVAPPDGRHNWWEFQVAFTKPVNDLAQLRQLYGIINLSKASEDELFRMFSPEYDHRPVRMDEHRFDDGGWMDDYSGRPRWEGGPYISFGVDGGSLLERNAALFIAGEIRGTSILDSRLGMRYDVDRFEGKPIALIQSFGEVEGPTFVALTDSTWGERWTDDPWNAPERRQLFVAVNNRDSASLLFEKNEDVWPDVYPPHPGTWADAARSHLIPSDVEST